MATLTWGPREPDTEPPAALVRKRVPLTEDQYQMVRTSLATPYAEVQPLPAEWVWQDRIPVGELTIMAGLGGTGKGLLCSDLAARISLGDCMPGTGDDPGSPGSVLLISAEDDPNVVMVNRLKAAGADMRRVYDLSTVDGAQFELPLHAGILRQTITEIGDVRLVILDPLAGVAPVSLTAVRAVRAILSPLRQIAQDTGCAIVITHHLTKGREVAGSRAIVDGVRSVLTIARDDDNPDIRIVSVSKTNMGADDMPDVRYKVVSGVEAACVEYVTAVEDKPATAEDQVLGVLEPGRDVSGQEIAAATGIPYSSARVLLARLVASGRAVSTRHGWFTRPAVTAAEVQAAKG